MDELTFILILAGISVVLLVAMFTYYKHHKNINDQIRDFNNHAHDIDDVLLENHKSSGALHSHDMLDESELPEPFSADNRDESHLDMDFDLNSRQTDGDIKQTNEPEQNDTTDDRELVDGVYIKSKKVLNKAHEKPAASVSKKTQIQKKKQQIKIVYDPLPDGVNDLIISHTIVNKGEFFAGQRVFTALENAGLSFGEMNVFHYPGDEKAQTFALFSVANIVEPGTFDPDTMETMTTPGLSLFLRLPTSSSNYQAYEKFIRVAQVIANELGGELCDETRSKLTQQAIAHKKELIKKLNFDITKAQKIADKKS